MGAALSAPIVTMGLSLALANMAAAPAASSACSAINAGLVPLAVPCLLFDADLARAAPGRRAAARVFAVGSAATVVGTLVAALLVQLKALGPDAWRVAGLAARHIGGAVNYVAVAEELGLAPATVTAGIDDNVVTRRASACSSTSRRPARPSPKPPPPAPPRAPAARPPARPAPRRARSRRSARPALALGCAVCAAG